MNGPTRPADKRRTPRIAVNFPVTVTSGSKRYRCRAREFSEFGILLGLNKHLSGDLILELALAPAGRTISLKAVVAYETETGIAARFKDISPEQENLLKGYIRAQTTSAAPSV